jgi:hypothetical protein
MQMNLAANPTRDQLRELFFTHQDAAGSHLLWVSIDGSVHLDIVPAHLAAADYEASLGRKLKFRFEEWEAGEGYTGPAGANDADWMNRLFVSLIEKWTGYQARAA